MDTIVYIFLTFLVYTQASIDSIFEEVEQNYHDSEVLAGKSGAPDWNEYEVANRTESYVRFQHDMIINKVVFDAMMESTDGRRKRNAVKHDFKIWPHAVPYIIDDSFDVEWRNQILLAIQHVMLLTCVDFKPLENETNYVHFVAGKNECLSHVGMEGGEQQLKLAVPKCVRKVSTIVHEIGHALGLFHEHMRNDRHNHVTIQRDHVLDGKLDQFRKLNFDEYKDHGKPYDYRSLMHYGKHYFARKDNGTKLITIQPTDHNYTDVIGNAVGLSFYDIQILNSMYQCAVGCQFKTCKPGEFLGKNCNCFCPGTPETAARPCTQQATCSLPFSNSSNEYCFYDDDDFGEELNTTITDELADGRTITIHYCDFWPCGEVTSKVTCKNGIWEGNTKLDCIKERCTIKPEWNTEYEVFTTFDNSNSPDPDSYITPHGQSIMLFCHDNSTIENKLECIHGKWKGQVIPCMGNACNVTYKTEDRFMYSLYRELLNDNDQVENGDVVEASCRNPNTDTEPTNVTCIDGELIGPTPTTCPRADSKCPVIVNAIVTTTQQINMFKVICVEGYDRLIQGTTNKLTTDILTCDVIGRWRPAVPFCSPAKCSVPPVDNGIVRKDADPLPIGHAVESGDDVTMTCKYGHVPDDIDVKCSLGKWTTEQFPFCTKVVCDKPNLEGTSFKPEREEHVYKDKVHVTKCKKNKEFKGDETLTCLQDGTWSGKASCTDYCQDGKQVWVDVNSRKFKWNGVSTRDKSFKACKRSCTKKKRFLCLTVSFGQVQGRRRNKIKCFLHKIDLNKQDIDLEKNYRWSISKRMCVQTTVSPMTTSLP